MSDVLPKMKLYFLISLVMLCINLGVFLCGSIINNSFDFSSFALSSGGSFVPFISLVSLALLNIPVEISIIIALFTSILSGIQTFILAMFILQTVHNIIWNPDV